MSTGQTNRLRALLPAGDDIDRRTARGALTRVSSPSLSCQLPVVVTSPRSPLR